MQEIVEIARTTMRRGADLGSTHRSRTTPTHPREADIGDATIAHRAFGTSRESEGNQRAGIEEVVEDHGRGEGEGRATRTT